MSRPICVHCRKAYGQRNTTNEFKVWPMGGQTPRYTGNSQIVATKPWHTPPHMVSGSQSGVPFGHNDHVVELTLWDGQSWYGGYQPFCTLRCALDYARKAYRKERKL